MSSNAALAASSARDLAEHHDASAGSRPGPIRLLAWYTVLELWRSRLPVLLLVLPLSLFGIVYFLGDLALTESTAVRLALVAPLTRVAVLCIGAVYAVALLARELSERRLDVLLAAAVSRGDWLFGRWLGFCVLGTGLSLLGALVLLPWADPLALFFWAISLVLEACLVAGACLVLCVALRQFALSLLALAAGYILARLIGVIALLSQGSGHGDAASGGVVGEILITALAHLLPRLDLFTRTEWLLAGVQLEPAVTAAVLWPVLSQTVLYAVVIALVALFDLGRRHD